MSDQYRESAPWGGLRDGPFPRVETLGELDRAEDEWLHTNGAGAYAMSTVALMHTRRAHGLLVAALQPPLDRYVVVSHADVEIQVRGRTYRLWTHRFPNIAPTPGYRLLRRFVQDPLPTWVFQVADSEFEMRLGLVRGANALVLSYRWRGEDAARLTVRPLMPFRPIRSLMREHGAMMQHVHLRPGEVEIRPLPELPSLIFRHTEGVFVGSPDWWRRFEYVEDLRAGTDFVEDMWTPGTFELELQPRRPAYLLAALARLPSREAHELLQETARYEHSQDPGPGRPPSLRALFVAASHFCSDACARPAVTAGFPVLDAIARDSLVAIPGLFLARGRLDEAKAVVRTLLRYQRGGLLPTRLPRAEEGQEEDPLPDATLLLLGAGRELVARLGTDDAFVRDELYPALLRAFECIRAGRARGLWLNDDGLVANGDDRRPLTWMDAVIGDQIVSPRRGLAVEMQAYWTKGTENLAALARAYGDLQAAVAAESACTVARGAFRSRFWCSETQYPFDCVSDAASGAGAWADATIRPNALIALAEDASLFDAEQADSILRWVRAELLTPRGLRSMAPREPGYRGHYEGPPEDRGSSYHQGTAWTHLLGYFVRASVQRDPDDLVLRDELRDRIEDALENTAVLGHIAQLADGEAPHRPRGCPAQAWSVAELTRALVDDLGV